MDTAEREAIIAAVTARVRSFGTYEVIAAGVRKGLPAGRSLDVTYADLEVSALGPEYALASATFSRDIVMEGTGAAVRQQGAVSWLWRKMGAQWLIVQGHISHPLEAAK